MRKNYNFWMAEQMEKQSLSNTNQKRKTPLKTGLRPWVGESPYVLILGTLPGDDSIENGMYYANPSNRFWEIMHNLFGGNPNDKSEDFITSHHIALWDCLKSAERAGSADKNIIRGTETPNDIISFLLKYPTIKTIIINGTSNHSKTGFTTLEAFKLYFEELCDNSDYDIIHLYQTSKRNEQYGRITIDMKLNDWQIVKKKIDAQTEVHKD